MDSSAIEPLLAELEREQAEFENYILSKNTQKSYRDSWKRFEKKCHELNREFLPASEETIALWITACLHDGLRINTIECRLCGVVFYHKQLGYPSPLGPRVRKVLNGAKRTKKEQPHPKKPLSASQILRMSRALDPQHLRDARDKAILVLGFAGAFRRSELAALDLADVEFVSQGLLVEIRSSKTDQFGHGRIVGIFRGEKSDTDPVRCLRAWLTHRGNGPGPLFCRVNRTGEEIQPGRRMHPETLVKAIKRAGRLAGLNPHLYAGHSLRSGYCTEAAANGATEMAIMLRTGHRSAEMVHRYVRPLSAFATNPLAGRI